MQLKFDLEQNLTPWKTLTWNSQRQLRSGLECTILVRVGSSLKVLEFGLMDFSTSFLVMIKSYQDQFSIKKSPKNLMTNFGPSTLVVEGPMKLLL